MNDTGFGLVTEGIYGLSLRAQALNKREQQIACCQTQQIVCRHRGIKLLYLSGIRQQQRVSNCASGTEDV